MQNRRYQALVGWLFGISVVITIVAIFWEPLFSGLFIWGPDSSSFVYIERRFGQPTAFLGFWDNMRGLGMGGFTQPMLPHHLLTLLLPADLIKPGIYIGSLLGTILAGVYWLRGRGMKGWPTYLGALALGLSSHTFSIIAAGHDGKTLSWPFCILLLAAVDRAVSRRSLFHFALAGYAAGVCFSLQPDMAMLLSFLAAAYGIFLFIHNWPKATDHTDRNHTPMHLTEDSQSNNTNLSTLLRKMRIKYVGRQTIGTILAGILLLSISMSTVNFVLSVVLPDREILASKTGTTTNTKKSEWEFATNWSFPPEETLELVAPCFFGIQTGDARGPYWGRLGRSLGWKEHHRGLMNLRQHTVYLGVLQIVFAVYALVFAFRYGRSSNRRTEIFFWTGVFIVALLLAMGRNFPLYRLFYTIPFASSLRAPVKFLHLVEVSAGILFAFGLDAVWKSETESNGGDQARIATKMKKRAKNTIAQSSAHLDNKRTKQLFGFGCIGFGVLFILGLSVLGALSDSLQKTWASMGMAKHSDLLMRLAETSLLRASVLLFVCAAVFLVAVYSSSRFVRRAAPVIVLLALALDLGTVDKRYISVWDEYLRLTPHELIKKVESDKTNFRLSMPVPGGIYEVWKRYIIPRNWITLLDSEDHNSFSADDLAFYKALSHNPIRLWQLTSTMNIVGPTASLKPLATSPALESVTYFDIISDGSMRWTAPNQGGHAWLKMRHVLPRAAIYPVAEYAEGTSWTNRLVDPSWNPARSVIVAHTGNSLSGEQRSYEPVKIVSYKPNRVEIVTQQSFDGVLMLNDRYDPKWEVFVDRKAAPLLRCNGIMRGVSVPAGQHKVVFLYRPVWPYFMANVSGTFLILIWSMARLFASHKRKGQLL